MSTKKVALVTGSGKRRVGYHVAVALAERGYALAIHYLTAAQNAAETVEQFRRQGTEARAFQADLSDEAAVKGMVGEVLDHFGRLDVLVNCASIWQRVRLEDV